MSQPKPFVNHHQNMNLELTHDITMVGALIAVAAVVVVLKLRGRSRTTDPAEPDLRDVVDELNHVLLFIGGLVARDANSEVGPAAVEEEVRETAKGGAERDATQTILCRNVDLRPCRQIGRVQEVVTDTELIGEVRGKEMALADYGALGDVGIGTVVTEPAAI